MKPTKEIKPASLPVGDLLTRAEAASILKVHTETVKRWQQAGRLRAFVLDKTVVRYAASDVTALLNDSAVLTVAA
jgi:predicted site-specific integrase-resolvase